MSTVYSTVNASFKHTLSEEALAELIKTGDFPAQFREHIYVFFTEVPVSAVYKFMKEQGITNEEIKDYYTRFIKEIYTNKELEEMLTIE